MAERLPFKIVPYEPGCAMVCDRETSTRVGYVLQDFHRMWDAFLDADPGRSVGYKHYRHEAAAQVWERHQERTA